MCSAWHFVVALTCGSAVTGTMDSISVSPKGQMAPQSADESLQNETRADLLEPLFRKASRQAPKKSSKGNDLSGKRMDKVLGAFSQVSDEDSQPVEAEDAYRERLLARQAVRTAALVGGEQQLDRVVDSKAGRRRRCAPDPSKPSQKAENQWSAWFSEEVCYSEYAARGVSGYACKGEFCDNNALKFGGVRTSGGRKWSHWFSEEKNGNARCAANQVVVEVQCSGGRCDNKRIACETVATGQLDQTQGDESGWFSEEQGAKVCRNKLGYIYQMYCRGHNCDNTFFKCGVWHPPENCIWQKWQSWSACNKACGAGTRSRKRGQTAPKYRGLACRGAGSESQKCNTQPCATKVNCIMNGWTAWGKCSKTCGGGTQTRTRIVQKQAAYGGKACPTDRSQTQACSKERCPRKIVKMSVAKACHSPDALGLLLLESYNNKPKKDCQEACDKNKRCSLFAVDSCEDHKDSACFLYQKPRGSYCELVNFACVTTFELSPYQEDSSKGALLIENLHHEELAMGTPKFPDPYVPQEAHARRHS